MYIDYSNTPGMEFLSPTLQKEFDVLQTIYEEEERKLLMEKIAGIRRLQK